VHDESLLLGQSNASTCRMRLTDSVIRLATEVKVSLRRAWPALDAGCRAKCHQSNFTDSDFNSGTTKNDEDWPVSAGNA
jgi:hypothetical protein